MDNFWFEPPYCFDTREEEELYFKRQREKTAEIERKKQEKRAEKERKKQEKLLAKAAILAPIYDEVNSAIMSQPKPDDTCNPSGLLQHNTFVLKNPPLLLNPSKSGKDVKTGIPNLGYGSTEKDSDPSIFSISGQRVVVSGDCKEKDTWDSGKHCMEKDDCSIMCLGNLCGDDNKKWNKPKLQLCTEYFSLLLFIPGCFLCVLTPWLIVPVYFNQDLMGNGYFSYVFLCFFVSTFLTFFGTLFGHIVWYKKDSRWRCMMTFGEGPRNHYWGNSLKSNQVETV